MADLMLRDRVKETSTTTGTGLMTLGGAVAGFRTFSAALGGTANVTYLIALDAEWEVGRGTYNSGGNTLTRDAVYSSSNAGSLVNFSSGAKEVSIVVPALILPVARLSGSYVPPKVLGTYDGMAWGGGALAGQNGLAIGINADAGYTTPGSDCIAIGAATAFGSSSMAIGPGAETTSATIHSEAMGPYAKARQPAHRVRCQHDIFTKGQAARIDTEVGALTTDATPTEMLAILGNRIKLPIYGTCWAFQVLLAAFRGSDSKAWAKKFEGAIKQNSGATTSLVGTPIETLLGDDFAGTISAAISADNTNGALKITVTGLASATIRWHANVHVASVSFY